MRAAVLEQQGEPLALRDDVEIEAPDPGEVRVRVSHCGVCHSDLSIVDGTVPVSDAGRARPRGRRRGRVRSGPGVRSVARRRPRRADAVSAVRPLLLVRAGRADALRELSLRLAHALASRR